MFRGRWLWMRREIVTLVTSGNGTERLGQTSEMVTNTEFNLASNILTMFNHLEYVDF